jgi:peptide/nickel transport system ATP-binding protein/oligopeptide transport system ATP-binding protein
MVLNNTHPAKNGTMSSILQIKDLKTFFYAPFGIARAVNGVSWSLARKEILGIVGESGCGKSVTALSILKLIPCPPGKFVHGEIIFEGHDLLKFSENQMRDIRGNKISMIFQDPMCSLDPVFTVGSQISEVFQLHRGMSRKEVIEHSIEMMRLVRIPSPEKRMQEYPYQMSGGMQQRIMIAMALACHPQILIADEPTTALDVTIQAQILDLMLQLREELETAIVLITHNFGIIAEMAQRVIVMYAGEVVEEAQVKEIFESPLHPYTQGLLKSMPRLDKTGRKPSRLAEIPGVVPGLDHLPEGCLFSSRCDYATTRCHKESPPSKPLSDQRSVRCWLHCN